MSGLLTLYRGVCRQFQDLLTCSDHVIRRVRCQALGPTEFHFVENDKPHRTCSLPLAAGMEWRSFAPWFGIPVSGIAVSKPFLSAGSEATVRALEVEQVASEVASGSPSERPERFSARDGFGRSEFQLSPRPLRKHE